MARQIETRLMMRAGVSGILGNVVRTFYSLCEEIVAHSDYFGSPISDVRKSIMIQDLVKSSRLSYFRASAGFSGFVDALGSIIGQLKLAKVTPDELESAFCASEVQLGGSRAKITELESLYRRYQSDILGMHNLHDREGLMWLALERSEYLLSDMELLIFDGFGDLNGIERELVAAAAAKTPSVIFTLDFEPDRPQVFHALQSTRSVLLKMNASETFLPRTTAENSSLRHVEESLFRDDAQVRTPDDSLWVLECGSPALEVEMVADEISKLVRGQGWTFRDIAITARDVESYRNRIERPFLRRGIRLNETDHRLAATSIAQLLLSCLNVIRNGWKRADVIRVLKSEHFESDLLLACKAEVNARQLGIISGRSQWLDDWRGNDDTRELRARVLKPLTDFEDQMNRSVGSEDYINVTRDLVSLFQPRVSDDVCHATDAAVIRTILDALSDILKTHQSTGRECSASEFFDELEMAISLGSYSVPRAEVDAVQIVPIGNIAARRFKAVFVMGMLEGVFPRQAREESFLSDADRHVLNAHLPSPLPEQLPLQHGERYLFYSAIASAEEKLYLCYPLADQSGRETLPSFYVREVTKLFDGKVSTNRRDLSQPLPTIADSQCMSSLEKSMVYSLVQLPEDEARPAVAVYNALQPKWLGLILADSQVGSAEITDPGLLKHLATSERTFTCTELEAYAACPFMHFCGKILGLEPIRQEMTALDEGSVLHNTLFRLFTKLRDEHEEDLDVNCLDVEDTVAQACTILEDEYVKQSRLANLPDHVRGTQLHALKCNLRRYIAGEIGDHTYGSFTPTYFELEFGNPPRPGRDRDPKSTNDPLVLEGEDGTKTMICGKIDRVDMHADGALVVDYKSGRAPEIREMNSGLRFQGLVYALALQNAFDLQPIGTEYRSLKSWKPSGYYLETVGIGKGDRALGSDAFTGKIESAKCVVLGIARDIRNGRIGIQPMDCKDYCSFRGICRMEDYVYKLMKLDSVVEEVDE